LPNTNEATPSEAEPSTDQGAEPAKSIDVRYEDEFPMEKFNVKVGVPTYTDEQYEKNFKSDDWSREETDFLMTLCREFDLRWILIADRYEPENIPPPIQQEEPQSKDETDSMEIDTAIIRTKKPYRARSMEELKARYYTIAAKMLETQTPANDMTQAEFQLWEKMRNFDAKTETTRKMLAEKLFERTKEEAEEEKILLEELHRITKNEDEFLLMRRDLYARLEPPPTMRRNGEEQSTAMYQTSSGLSALLQNLLAREKKFKRPSMMTPGGPDGGHGPHSVSGSVDADGQPKKQKWEKGQHPNQYTRRDTMDTQNGDSGPQKKGSQSGPHVRILAPAEELKFGVSHPQERLTSGVQFRHEKVHRLVAGKSAVQMQKYQAALIELGVPTRLVMPTEKVCKEFERLVMEIQVLLDARKTSEKLVSEIKVLEEQRRIRLGLPKDKGDQENNADHRMDVDAPGDEDENENTQADVSMMTNEEHEENEDNEDNEENEDEDADADADADVEAEAEAEARAEAGVKGETDDRDEEAEEDEAEEGRDEEDEDGDKNEEDNDGPDMEDYSDVAKQREGHRSHEAEDSGESEQGEEEASLADEDEEEVAESQAESGDEGSIGEPHREAAESDNEGSQDAEAEVEAEVESDPEAQDSDEASEKAEPTSLQLTTSGLHKRSASVISEASRAGSNRSAAGRKKRR
jgi:DNA methyltransferase 1-associated protein 1